jgi:hypothetical protein
LCNFGILPFPSSSLDIQILTFIFDIWTSTFIFKKIFFHKHGQWIYLNFFFSFFPFLSFFEPIDFEMATWWNSNISVIVPVGDASQLCPGLEIYQNV